MVLGVVMFLLKSIFELMLVELIALTDFRFSITSCKRVGELRVLVFTIKWMWRGFRLGFSRTWGIKVGFDHPVRRQRSRLIHRCPVRAGRARPRRNNPLPEPISTTSPDPCRLDEKSSSIHPLAFSRPYPDLSRPPQPPRASPERSLPSVAWIRRAEGTDDRRGCWMLSGSLFGFREERRKKENKGEGDYGNIS
ncbi:hypothetical protein AKJ16_DCAP24534 [Drosera capensis]